VRPRRAGASRYGPLAQPGREQPLDVAAAARARKAVPDPLVLDHDDRRYLFDPEALGQLGVLVDVDVEQLEGVVVAPPLLSVW